MDRLFLDQLKRLCTTHPTRAKWVVVPTHTIGRTLGDRLAREGCDWANLRFVTPFDLALRMGAPFLVERAIDPSGEGLGAALVMRLLLTLPEEGGHFRPLATQPDLAVALWSTIRELRMAGVKAADLKADAFVSPEKHAELAGLLGSYETYLTTDNRGDRAMVFEEAQRHPDWCPVHDEDCLVELPGIRWQTLEHTLLTSLPGERIAIVDELADVSALLSHDVTERPSADLQFFTAGGVEAEVEEVFRRVLVSGVSLDTVEIACASDRYPALIWEKALRYAWPVTLAAGIPATLTRPGRLLLGWVQWIEDDFAAGRLRRLLQSGDLKPSEDVGLSPARAARLVIKAQAAWGRETYRLAFTRLAASERRRAARDDLEPDYRDRLLKAADEAEKLATWVSELIGAVPMPDADGLVDVVAIAESARGCIATAAARTSALDHAAATRLDETLKELQSLGGFRCPMHQALRFIRERVEGLSIGSDRARPGHLFVSSLRDAGLPGRAHVFIVGLEEGRVVPAAIEDPIVLDVERARIHADLQTSSARVDEAVHVILRRLMAIARSPGVRLCCSYSCRDLRQFSETYASWVMLHLYRLAAGNPEKSYGDLREYLGRPVSCVPATDAESLGAGRWWLRRVTAAGEARGRKAVETQFPALAAGRAAADARESDAFTAYDGHVPEAGPGLDPCAPAVVSPTQLEKAAGCPFRYFLERGLKVAAIESGERDRDIWLNPLIRGSLLHDLYASLLRRTRADERAPSVKTDRTWFREQARETLATLAIEMPPPSLEVRDRESRDFLDDIDLFLENEEKLARSRTAVGLEVAFGRRDPDDPEALSTSEPVTVKAGALTFQVVGRVDRIDRLADGSFSIVDYKTGSFWRDRWKGVFAGGRRLQHALYGLAAETLLKQITKAPKISAAQYYFPSRKGALKVKTIGAQSPAAIGQVLGDLRDVLTRGLFLHTPDQDDCKFCDYQAACGATAHACAKAKLDDPMLAPIRRLADHA